MVSKGNHDHDDQDRDHENHDISGRAIFYRLKREDGINPFPPCKKILNWDLG